MAKADIAFNRRGQFVRRAAFGPSESRDTLSGRETIVTLTSSSSHHFFRKISFADWCPSCYPPPLLDGPFYPNQMTQRGHPARPGGQVKSARARNPFSADRGCVMAQGNRTRVHRRDAPRESTTPTPVNIHPCHQCVGLPAPASDACHTHRSSIAGQNATRGAPSTERGTSGASSAHTVDFEFNREW